MADINKLISDCLNKAYKLADLEVDNAKKAKIYTDIATALAIKSAGMPSAALAEEDKEDASAKQESKGGQSQKDSSGRNALVRKPAPPKEPCVDEEDNAPVDASITESAAPDDEQPFDDEDMEFTTEWTDQAKSYFAKEIDFIAKTIEEWGQDTVNEALAMFMELDSADAESDLNPLNIRAFVQYVKAMMADEGDIAV